MICELRIKNLALIERLSFEFKRGFTVFTGETGAGKSILIGAIGLLLGDRASSESIRSGCDEAEVSGSFDLRDAAEPLAELLGELSIETDDDLLIVRRRISRSDRSRIHINETPCSLAALRRIGDLLIDLHGQHDHQALLNEDTHRTYIDRLEGVPPTLREYSTTYTAYAEAKHALAVHAEEMRLLDEKKEIVQFQVRELRQAELKSGEEEELEAELSLLSSSAERIEATSAILEMLGSSSTTSIEKQAGAVQRKLEQLRKYDPSVLPWIDDVENSLRVFTELETFCSSYLSTTDEQADPFRIEKINGRLAKLQRLKKKYGTDIDGLITREQALARDLVSLENSETDHRELQKMAASTREQCLTVGRKLSSCRAEAAKKFDTSITAMMKKLGFRGGRWYTAFRPCEEPTEHGLETARFLVRTNPGEAELPLSKTASGGEISRLMLAIKTVLSKNDYVPVLIFDEIDTGIGGLLAGAVGKALKSLSISHQVLCISHLHQIASLADRQVKVYKEESGGRTLTRIRLLSEEERVKEVARMLGGDSGIALDHARELLQKS